MLTKLFVLVGGLVALIVGQNLVPNGPCPPGGGNFCECNILLTTDLTIAKLPSRTSFFDVQMGPSSRGTAMITYCPLSRYNTHRSWPEFLQSA